MDQIGIRNDCLRVAFNEEMPGDAAGRGLYLLLSSGDTGDQTGGLGTWGRAVEADTNNANVPSKTFSSPSRVGWSPVSLNHPQGF